MSGFNSFVVKECSPLSDGVLVMALEFNEITVIPRHDRRYLDHHMDDYQYNQGHRNSYDRNTDRHQYEDHRNSYQDYRNQGRYQEKGEFRDYGIPLRDSQPWWNSYRGEERGESEVVQAYGVIMEYGYVSKSAAMPAQDQPLTGTRLDLTNVWLRCEVDHNNIFLTLY